MIVTRLHSFYGCLLSVLLCAGHIVGVKKTARALHSGPCVLIRERAGKQPGEVTAHRDAAQREAREVFSCRVAHAMYGEGGERVL